MFDQRCLEHSQEMENNTRLFLRNYKVLNKKVKTIGELYVIINFLCYSQDKYIILLQPTQLLSIFLLYNFS